MKFIKKKNKKINVKPTMQVTTTKKNFSKPKAHMANLFKLNSLVLIATLFIMIGLICVSYNYIETKKELAFDIASRNIKPKTIAKAKPKKQKEEPTEQSQPEQKQTNTGATFQYIGYLDIPAIKLSKGFLDKSSPYNNVDKNILVLKESDYPDVENGNLIIAGHSGTGPKAFFKYLYKLKVGDVAKVTYNKHIYTYKITSIEEQPKTGTITINRDYNKRTLTLITCTFQNDTAQTIYLLECINIEKEES